MPSVKSRAFPLVSMEDPFVLFQNVYYHLTGEFYVGPLIAKTDAEDNCLTDPGKGEKPTLEPCSKAVENGLYIHWDFKPVSPMFGFVFKDRNFECSLRSAPLP